MVLRGEEEQQWEPTLADLAEIDDEIANGLQQVSPPRKYKRKPRNAKRASNSYSNGANLSHAWSSLCFLSVACVCLSLQLLSFDGDVKETFELTFVYEYQAYGETISCELKPGGAVRV